MHVPILGQIGWLVLVILGALAVLLVLIVVVVAIWYQRYWPREGDDR